MNESDSNQMSELGIGLMVIAGVGLFFQSDHTSIICNLILFGIGGFIKLVVDLKQE